MNLFLCESPAKNLQEKTINHAQDPIYEPVLNPNEFSGDVTHVTQHPLIHTEECIAAGCPEDLW